MTEGYFFRGEPVSFDVAFPDIENIKIEGTEGSLGSGFGEHQVSLNKESLLHVHTCSNRACHDGKYELGDFISEMYRKKEVSKKGIVMCK